MNTSTRVNSSRRFRMLSLVTALMLFGAGLTALPAGAIVPEEIREDLPIVLDGRVYAISQIGSRVIVGGNFTQVRTRRGGPIIDQPYLFAYNVDTGEFDQNFRPDIDAEVRDIENDPDGKHIYFAGKFKNVDGLRRGRVARYNVRRATIDRRFRGRANSKVESIAVLGDSLVMGGNFLKVAKEPREYLALVDRRNGKPLPEFNHDFGEAIGRPFTNSAGVRLRTAGVHRVAVRPGTNEVLVAHRHDTVSGQTAPGLAMFSPTGTLLPWTTDVYTPTTCVGGWGIAITDISWSPDGTNFAVGHTGHDTGIVCDALVKFSYDKTDPLTEVRQPLWSSRVFDSIFAVEYGPDAIYLGGHFRYLIHPSAPNPYPGKTTGPYTADPTRDATFDADLVQPGYVYFANQIGAINPTTGFGMPEWGPTSNAAKGILTMTLGERGLLIGQDNGQINDIVVGRAAQFDPTPTAGHINCTVTLDATGRPLLTWSGIADAGEPYRIARNGRFLTSTTATSLVDPGTFGGETVSYAITYRRYNETVKNHECGMVTSLATGSSNLSTAATATQSSIAGINIPRRGIDSNLASVAATSGTGSAWYEIDLGRQADIDAIGLWNGGVTNLENVSVLVSVGGFSSADITQVRAQRDVIEMKAAVVKRHVRFGKNVSGRYVRVYLPAGPLSIAEIEVLGTLRPALTCQAVPVSDDTIGVSWNNVGAGRYTVVADGRATSVGSATSYSHVTGITPGTHTYEIRAFERGARSDVATCESILPVPDIGCAVSLINGQPTVTWNNVAWTSKNIARNGAYVSAVSGTTWTDAATNLTGTQTYELRVRADGQKYVGSCGSVTLP